MSRNGPASPPLASGAGRRLPPFPTSSRSSAAWRQVTTHISSSPKRRSSRVGFRWRLSLPFFPAPATSPRTRLWPTDTATRKSSAAAFCSIRSYRRTKSGGTSLDCMRTSKRARPGVSTSEYLCQHRSLWYVQENRPPAPVVCTYIGRGDAKSGRPFRFILNHSRATVANVYLAMYPTPILARAMARDPGLIRRVWQALNAITPDQLLGEGRVYGGGLHKLEPNELASVPVPQIAALLPDAERPPKQADLLAFRAS